MINGRETFDRNEVGSRRTKKVEFFVGCVVMAGTCAAGLLGIVSPALPEGAWPAIGLLTLLAIIGEAWSFLLPQSAATSIAFIPYMAMALVVPHWTTVLAIGALRAIEALRRRADVIKSVFNVAQFVLVFSITIEVYLVIGGQSFLGAPHGIAAITKSLGWAALGAYAVSVALNMALTSFVIALASDRSAKVVWSENHQASLGLDLIAAPATFGFAYVYTAFGPIAAALLWIPLIGFRHWVKTTVDLAQTNRELLELMIKSIEARDPYTSGHSRRVSQYARLIARSLRMSEREIDKVATAALLHDVGKIHEKYGPILRKTEKLTVDEWAVMKEHPADGAELVATMTRLTEFVPAIMHHHEKWNGAGYPDGIQGVQIPVAARIIMVADTIDAMTTVRPYRGALSEDEVRSELSRCRGEQFDPAIIDNLLASSEWQQLFAPAREMVGSRRLALLRVTGGQR